MLDRVLDFIELSHFSALVFDGQLASSAPRSALLLLRPPSLLVGSPSDSTRVVPFFFLSPLILQLIFIQIQIFNLSIPLQLSQNSSSLKLKAQRSLAPSLPSVGA
jgi:hypothetical protein